jgi:hypothetical protein
MKFIDDLYNYYKDKLTADDEDVELLVFSILQDMNKKDILKFLGNLEEKELYQLTGNLLSSKLKEKIIQEQGTDVFPLPKNTYLN